MEENARDMDTEAEKDGAVKTKHIQFMSIIGQIEGHYILPDGQKGTKYEHMLPALAEIEQRDDISGLLLMINTVGGDVEAGLAIAEMIASMTKPTVSLVLGGGHSIGIPLAVAAKKSFIVPSATMTVHPVRINGLVIGVPQSFENLRRMQQRITQFICRNSKIQPEVLNELMMETDEMVSDIGSVLDGEEAVKLGLVDSLGGLCDAIRCLNEMINSQK